MPTGTDKNSPTKACFLSPKEQERDKRLLENNCLTLLLDTSENSSLYYFPSGLRLVEEGS